MEVFTSVHAVFRSGIFRRIRSLSRSRHCLFIAATDTSSSMTLFRKRRRMRLFISLADSSKLQRVHYVIFSKTVDSKEPIPEKTGYRNRAYDTSPETAPMKLRSLHSFLSAKSTPSARRFGRFKIDLSDTELLRGRTLQRHPYNHLSQWVQRCNSVALTFWEKHF